MNTSIDPSHRQQALEAAFATIERTHGRGAIMRMDDKSRLEVETISTGSLAVDLALGVGGYPRGRLVEVYGPEASGKTTLALHAIASVQAAGGTAAFIDAEHALDPVYAAKLGVKMDELLVAQPDSGEQALEIAEVLVRSGAVEIVVVDSVAALVPQAELEGTMTDVQVGLQARLMSKAMRKLATCVSRSKAILLFINQVRHKIGVTFGSNETTSGGKALRYFASVRIDIRRIGGVKRGSEVVGNRTRIKVVKNKLAPPFRQVELDLVYGEGLSRHSELVDLGLEHKILTKNGAWYSWGEDSMGQGRDAVTARLAEEPELAGRLRVAILAMARPQAQPQVRSAAAPQQEVAVA
jgi:recombination protein RecA